MKLPLELLPHQDRMIQERIQLADEVNKLEAFVKGETFSKVTSDEQELLNEQLEHMANYLQVLDHRVMLLTGVKAYRCIKNVFARDMDRASYNLLRGWELPANENGADEGYLVEDTDGGQSNHPDFAGYITWVPKEMFERQYRERA